MRQFLSKLIAKYLSFFVLQDDSLLVLQKEESPIEKQLQKRQVGLKNQKIHLTKDQDPDLSKVDQDYVFLNGLLHYHEDIEGLFNQLAKGCSEEARIITIYYNQLWRPFIWLATVLGIRKGEHQQNWVSPSDLHNFAEITNLELVTHQSRVLLPIPIPIIGHILNRYLAPLPIFNWMCLFNIAVLKPQQKPMEGASVTVLVPARNEAGNIEPIVQRVPKMGPDDELIFVEGGSSDHTWEEIQRVAKAYEATHTIRFAQQEGKGKGDAVRKGFGMAEKDILMILDADITVPPEDLPRFYKSITQRRGEFINGSRLFYPLEDKAMRFFNILGNKFFALAFSFVLSRHLKDTLCGTKVLTKENYDKLAANRSYFGEFDPFGDFDLLFGSARMGLKIVEVPIHYKARTYGDTNIQRWKHGMVLLRMLLFAARKIKFL